MWKTPLKADFGDGKYEDSVVEGIKYDSMQMKITDSNPSTVLTELQNNEGSFSFLWVLRGWWETAKFRHRPV